MRQVKLITPPFNIKKVHQGFIFKEANRNWITIQSKKQFQLANASFINTAGLAPTRKCLNKLKKNKTKLLYFVFLSGLSNLSLVAGLYI